MRLATGVRRHRRGGAQLAFFALALLLASCTGGAPASTPGGGHASGTPPPTAPATATLSPKQAAAQAAAAAHAYRERQIRATANWYLSRMSLDEKLGQMFLIETVWQGYNTDVDNMVAGMHAGAMIIYKQNMASPAQLKSYIASIQAHAAIPLMVSIDEEGGGVDRLGDVGFFPPQDAALTVANSGNPSVARQEGETFAHELKAMGINVDLAPVVDVMTTPYPAELYTRFYGPYGTSPSVVEAYAGAFLQSLQQHGIAGTLKHWPGIGSTTQDPHETLPTIGHSKAELQTIDFAPFRALLADDPAMIMVTHVMVPAYDQTFPATFSPTLVDGVLRGELGYQGVVMTDSLYMGGIKAYLNDDNLYTELPKAAVLAVEAGDDLLEGAFDSASMSAMVHALKAAVSSGRISRSRIDDSARRILMLKARFGLLPLIAAGPLPPAPSSASAAIAPATDADVPRAA
ncbi:MAG TPA: glycoside hydrolase family 3 N-terminal domain-containing protein [Ktedonobacterales bacterium]|nr:glycoside hydrolase family 3 N-terminal domain-containing protein [Ktedonobacterales bacterium]